MKGTPGTLSMLPWLVLPFSATIASLLLAPRVLLQKTADRTFLPLLVLVTYGSVTVYFLGRENFAGGGASPIAAAYYFFIHFVPFCAFLLCGACEKLAVGRAFAMAAGVFVVITAVTTYFLRPDLIPERKFYLPFLLDENNSPGLINALSLSAALLTLIYRSRLGLCYVALGAVVSIVWLNRTGVIISAVTILAWIVLAAPARLRPLIVLATSLMAWQLATTEAFTTLLIYERFAGEGLSSMRWPHQLDALEHLFRGDYEFGGYTNTFSNTIWVHHILLDAYRLAGIPGAAAWTLVVVVCALIMLHAPFSLRHAVVWIFGVIVAGTSVFFEANLTESMMIFICLTLPAVRLPHPPRMGAAGLPSDGNVPRAA